MQRFFFISASVGGLLAVALGAFAAHALKGKLDAHYLSVFETAVRYQMYHSLALFSLSLFAVAMGNSGGIPRAILTAQWFFLLGVIVFSGSLYVLVFSEVSTWGAVTPIGGVMLIVAWFSAALGGISLGQEKES